MTRNSRSPNRRRRRSKNPIQMMRGLVIETLGVAALVFLYFTMQASSANETAANQAKNERNRDARLIESSQIQPNASIESALKPGIPAPEKMDEFPIWTCFNSRR